jgi:hypothetical protein
MKRMVLSLALISSLAGSAMAQALFPYTLGASSDLDISGSAERVKANLTSGGFRVLGEYQPAGDKNRWLIVITSEELIKAAGKTGGLTGFAAALRVALTFEIGKVRISYTTPGYWFNAYYRDQYEQVESILEPVSGRLDRIMQESGTYSGKGFGSEKGLTADHLRSYRYMLGMPKFQNTIKLATFSSYREAIDKIETNLIKGIPGVRKVYSVEIPGKELKLYGLALSGEKGESHFLPVIDISEPKQTAFLPYEFLVMGNEVLMLQGRYRIALSFPDLSMGDFIRIMSTAGDIKDLLESVVR